MGKSKAVGKKIAALFMVLTAAGGGVYFFFFSPASLETLSAYLLEETNRYVFLLLMALFPLLGLPISVFLVLIGVIFGIGKGIVLASGVTLFHLVVSYGIAHSMLHPLLVRILHNSAVPVPRLPEEKRKRISFIFMVVPGLPYALKNYVLAMADIPFPQYLVIGWLAHLIVNTPFIVLGRGLVRIDPVILVGLGGLFLLGIGGYSLVKKRDS